MNSFAAGQLGDIALAATVLGIASYGFVDLLKFFEWVDLCGFERLFSCRGTPGGRIWLSRPKNSLDCFFPALKITHGAHAMDLFKTQYRAGRTESALSPTLKEGIFSGFCRMQHDARLSILLEIGIDGETAARIACEIEHTHSEKPASALIKKTIDARIDAALLLADSQFATQSKILATLVSLGIASAIGIGMHVGAAQYLLVGITAVPLAPVAKDLATALQETARKRPG